MTCRAAARDAPELVRRLGPPHDGKCHVRQKRRRRIECAQRRGVDFGDDGRVEAVDPRVLEVDRLVERAHGRVRNADVEEVVRHELEQVERLELALYAKRGALDLR